MASRQFALLGSERFAPLFATQALGAFNDSVFRSALAILITYELAPALDLNAALLIMLATGIFIAPFFILSATAGLAADKYDKSQIARLVKIAEIAIMACAALALHLDSLSLLFFVLLLTGIHSTFFGPVKYGILPQHLQRDELIGANALIESTTFLAILLGTLFGGIAVATDNGRTIVGVALVTVACLGYLASRRIPAAPPPAPHIEIGANIVTATASVLRRASDRRDVFQAILGISWFWFLGVVFLTEMPAYAKDVLGADELVANLFIAIFTVGIGIGSLANSRILQGEISARYVPLAALLMTVFMFDLWLASPAEPPATPEHLTIPEFLSRWQNVRILADLLLVSLFGGLYVVPLYAIVQSRAARKRRARTIAANNIWNSAFMTAASAAAALALALGAEVDTLFLLVALLNTAAAILICALLPQELAKSLGARLLRLIYRVEVKGLENYRSAGQRVMIVANHASDLDGLLLGAFLPDRCLFVVSSAFASTRWVKPAHAFSDLLPLDPANPLSARAVVSALRRGQRVVVFPEGRVTVTGALMKVHDAPAALAHMAGARVLPVRIEGSDRTIFSRLRARQLGSPARITITVLEPVDFAANAGLKGARLREHLAQHLYDVMTDMVFRTSRIDQNLFEALLDARRTQGRHREIIEDIQRTPLTYDRLVLGSFVLGRKLAALTPGQDTIGVLLPNAAAALVAYFGLLAHGRVPALLNFSTGGVNMAAACTAARIVSIVTSRRFLEQGGLEEDAALLSKQARIIYLEDVRESVRTLDKLTGLLAARLPKVALRFTGYRPDPHAPAVILFTSGSEGVPKGVVLSHRNLNANRHQTAARIDFSNRDIVFNAMPMFHAFGLTIGTLLPVLAGVRTFLYPSPLHYKLVPELCYDTDATIMFGTDTFLTGYAKNAHPYDFYSIRYVVAGAERVRAETRAAWMEKFGLRIIEGYGATECSPVISANTPIYFKSGSVGRFFDAIEHRLEPVAGIARGGRLIVKGPNIMLGYLRADEPGRIAPPPEGWYDTGDIVDIDEQGFITILGRAKRFAKIGGEMVSLAGLETKVAEAFPEHAHAIVALPDPRRGERLVLVTTDATLDQWRLTEALRKSGASELARPRDILHVEALPVLGSGKLDYVGLDRLVRERIAA